MKKSKSIRERILIVNVNWLGDVLFSTAAIKAIRDEYPESFIACMIVPRCKEILEDNPYLNEIIIYDDENEQRGILGKIRFLLALKKKRFDCVFLFQRSFTRLFLCFLAAIPERIGYYRKKTGFLLTKKIEFPSKTLHRAKSFLNLVEKSGIKRDVKNCNFFVSQNALNSMKDFLRERNVKEDDFLVVINPGGNWSLKRWPWERFAQLADKIADKFEAKIIITGSKKDLKLSKKLGDKMKHPALITCGKTNLKELGALLRFSSLVISADSGPMHIAISQETPTVALFGPTSIEITGPYTDKTPYRLIQKDVNCLIPCYSLDCPKNLCMQMISVDDVLKAVDDLKIKNPKKF